MQNVCQSVTLCPPHKVMCNLINFNDFDLGSKVDLALLQRWSVILLWPEPHQQYTGSISDHISTCLVITILLRSHLKDSQKQQPINI